MPIQTGLNHSNKRLHQIICSLLATTLLAGCGEPTITATSLVRIQPGDGDKSTYETYKKTQAQLLKSTFVLRAALRPPEVAQTSTLNDLPKPVEWLEKHIKTKFPGDSEILEVSLQCRDADDAKAIVDAVVKAYLNEVAQSERNDRAERLEILRATYREQTKKLKEAFKAVDSFAAEMGCAGSVLAEKNQEIVMDNIKTLKSELSKLKYDLFTSQTELYVQKTRQQIEKSPTPTTPESDVELLAATSRHAALTAAAQTCRKECDDEIQKLRDLTGFSAELEVKKLETSILTERVTALSNQIYDLEMELKQENRIQLIQTANTKKDDDLF